MANYLDDGWLQSEEPPDLLPVDYTDADVPDEAPDFGAPPDFMPAGFVPPEPPDLDEPPADFLPPAYLLDVPEPVLEALRASGWQEDVAPMQMSFLDEPPAPALDTTQSDGGADPRTVLEADLAEVLRQLDQVEANENPIERTLAQDELLEQQAALEEELQSLGVNAAQEQGVPLVAAERGELHPDAAADPTQEALTKADLSDDLISDIGQEAVNQPLPPFQVEDIEAAMTAREAGIVEDSPAPDSFDALVERMPGAERAELNSREAEDQARIEDRIAQAEQAVEVPGTVQGEALWQDYGDAVLAGQNPGGTEAALIQPAEKMNLADARFVAYSAPAPHHATPAELTPNTA